MSWGELYGPFLSCGIPLSEARQMSLREINRQNRHWAAVPPPVYQLLRIGLALGLKLPDPVDDAPVTPSSEDELRAVALRLGVAIPEVSHAG